MAAFLEGNGSRVMTTSPVEQIVVEQGRACGARLESGETLRARRAVVSALEPRQTFLRMLDGDLLEDEFLEMVRGYSFGRITVCRVHLALAGTAAVRQRREHEPLRFPPHDRQHAAAV